MGVYVSKTSCNVDIIIHDITYYIIVYLIKRESPLGEQVIIVLQTVLMDM